MPPQYLDAAEQAEKDQLSYNPILDDFSLADRFHWDEEKIGRQREEWLLGIECAMIADGMVKATAQDDVRQKRANAHKEKKDHEHESTRGLSIAKIRLEQDFPEDMPDAVIERIIGRVS